MEIEQLRSRLFDRKPQNAAVSGPIANGDSVKEPVFAAPPPNGAHSMPVAPAPKGTHSIPVAQQVTVLSSAMVPGSDLIDAVNSIFAPTEAFRADFANMGSALELLTDASRPTIESFQQIQRVYDHLATLSSGFQELKSF